MKNVSKKLFSLVLAAVLLLSVVPFQALAADGGFQVELYIDNGITGERKFTKVIDEKAGSEYTVQNYLDTYLSEAGVSVDDCSGFYYDVLNENNEFTSVEADTKITEAATLVIRFMPKDDSATQPEQPPVTEPKPEETKPEETKPEETKPEDKGDIHFTVSVYDASNKNKKIESLSYSSVAPYGTEWDLYDTQNTLDSKGYYISRFVVDGKEETQDLTFTVNKEGMKIEVYATKRNDSSEETKPEDEKPVDPKEKTDVVIKVYDYKGNKKVDTIYYTGKRGNIVDLEQIVNKYVIRQFRYEGKSTNSRIKLEGTDMEIVAIMDEDQGNMCTVTFRVHFKNATERYTYKFKSGTKIDIGKILVEDDVLDSVKEIEKIYLRGVHVNKNNNEVTVKKSGTYEVYTDEKPYDSEDHDYESGSGHATGSSYALADQDEDLTNTGKRNTVKLLVYLDGKFDSPAHTFTLDKSIRDSDLLLDDEVYDLVESKFTAKSSRGIDYGEGIYVKEGKWISDWAESEPAYDEIYNINAGRNDRSWELAVVISNARLKSGSSSNADSSNPKTGDSIFVAVSVMAVSSLALGAAYVLNKKRMAR